MKKIHSHPSHITPSTPRKSRARSRRGRPLANYVPLDPIVFRLLPYNDILYANSKAGKRIKQTLDQKNHTITHGENDTEEAKIIINDEYANSLDIIEMELFYQLIYKTTNGSTRHGHGHRHDHHSGSNEKPKQLKKVSSSHIKNEQLTTSLIINTILALITYYLRANCIKSFSIFQQQPIIDVRQFRIELLNLASKFYGIAINKLRKLLTLKNYNYYYYNSNITIGLICSSLLNKMSIYQYSNLNHSITFSKGFISIFNDLLSDNSNSTNNSNIVNNHNNDVLFGNNDNKNLTWIVNFLIFASKTIYFPPYSPKLLSEFKQVLAKFKHILIHSIAASASVISAHSWSSIIFNFNHLNNFLNQLLHILSTNSTTNDISPIILYKLLRHWLIILPSKIFILENLINQFEICLMYLFKTLTHILDNIFPQVNFFFLQNFSGNGIKLWYEPFHYNIDLVNFIHNKFNNNFELNEINKYCIRIITFFKKRYNILSIFFGDQLKSNVISPENIKLNLNEIMIAKFWNSNPIQYYHYLHLPNVINLSNQRLINLLRTQNKSTMINPLTSLYEYNMHHLNHFKINSKTRIKKLKSNTQDPIIRFHMSNLTASSPPSASQLSPSSSSSMTTPQQTRTPDDEESFRLINANFSYDHPSNETDEDFYHHHHTHFNKNIIQSNNSSQHEHTEDDIDDSFHKYLAENDNDDNSQTGFNYDHFLASHFSHIFASALTKDYETLLLKMINNPEASSPPHNDIEPLQYINFNMDYKTGLLINDKEPLHFIVDLAKEEELRTSNESETETKPVKITKSDLISPPITATAPTAPIIAPGTSAITETSSLSTSTSSTLSSTTSSSSSSHVQIYKRKLQNLSHNNQEIYDIIIQFYNLRNNRLNELINDNDNDDDFYDDLNVSYFELSQI